MEERSKARRNKKNVWTAMIGLSIFFFFICLPFSELGSILLSVHGHSIAVALTFVCLSCIVIAFPCWYFGICCIVGIKRKKIRSLPCSPQWSCRGCLSATFWNGWFCVFCLLFCVLFYISYSMVFFGPETSYYIRLTSVNDIDEHGRVETANRDSLAYYWQDGFVPRNATGRITKGDVMYCLFPTLSSSAVDVTTPQPPINMSVFIACEYAARDFAGRPFTCWNVHDKNGEEPRCFKNVYQQNLYYLVGVNIATNLDYIEYDGKWLMALEELKESWNETYKRPFVAMPGYTFVDLYNRAEFDDLISLWKIAFYTALGVLQFTVLGCLLGWCGFYWLTTRQLDDDFFDDDLLMLKQTENRGLIQRAQDRSRIEDPLERERQRRESQLEAERNIKQLEERRARREEAQGGKKKKTIPARGTYDLLGDDKEMHPL